ncbi:hypothetical protein [Natronomonas marina]|jgi:hypothetical protein|uniref:hypothetical protein n=1 Tax=Natronomonas marina TaxID=2961939 RepID=UPI0020C9B588|nr:hypothetical protein [Natronomonas marina]
MYRAILPNGQLECAAYEKRDHGIDCYDADEEFLAFVPYESLEALLAEGAYERRAPSVM